ncbi:MAG: carboxypeptidase-like regulatory domain-containing protein [Chitinophagales bacterium]
MKKLLLLLLLTPILLFAQEEVNLKGRVVDVEGEAIIGANVRFESPAIGSVTDKNGYFSIQFEMSDLNFPVTLVCSYVGFETYKREFTNSDELNIRLLKIELKGSSLDSVEITAQKNRDYLTPITIEAKDIEFAPTPNSSVESVIGLSGNVRGASELSNQYSVRGGNYDENLVYVNGFEIYRPFLMRAGQQEGLSFINPDLVRDISFSTGGFDASYGDKMSSVLDIKYKRPTEFNGSVTGSLRGAAVHFEGATKLKEKENYSIQKFRYIVGVRYQNTAALLKSLDTKGQYNPNAYDIQTNLIYHLNNRMELEVLFNHSVSSFNLVPSESSTTTGAINQAIRFSVFFDGNEKDKFINTMGGLAFKYYNSKVSTTFSTSAFRMKESENFNIIGQYRLDEVETDFSSDDFGDVKATLGVGTFHDWGRNNLEATVANVGNTGIFNYKKHLFQWGASFQYEIIDDELSEWERLDSAGYSLPYTGEQVTIFKSLKSQASLSNWRTQGYLMNVWNFEKEDAADVSFNVGLRYHYWNFNKQLVISPRAQLAIVPKLKKEDNVLIFKFAGGLYEQPPFYREIRDRQGEVQEDVKAQRSIHAVAGVDYAFKTWNDRNFKLTADLFYKHLTNVNPYELDDIRIRYYGENSAKGYAYGADVRLYGELVKGADSWISFGILKIGEDLFNDSYNELINTDGEVINYYTENQTVADTNTVFPGSISKPTEQVFNFGMYFSDYMTKNKNFKMHLALNFGTGLPYGPPDGNRYTDVLRAPGYKRVDIGFSALLVGGEKKKERRREGNFGEHFDKVWLSAEIFNLLGNRNTISYRWITDVQNNQWPIPNYLTSRRFNVKLHIKFS